MVYAEMVNESFFLGGGHNIAGGRGSRGMKERNPKPIMGVPPGRKHGQT